MDGAGHNNVEKFASDYLQRIKQFISHVDRFVIERNLQLERDAGDVSDEEDMRGQDNSVQNRGSSRDERSKGSRDDANALLLEPSA